MTLPPMPPPDPLGGVPGGDPLGPIPGSEPPPRPNLDSEPAVPEQRVTRIPSEAEPLPWQRREPSATASYPPPVPPAPVFAPSPAQARDNTKIKAGLVSLAVIFGLALCGGAGFGMYAMNNSSSSSSVEVESVPDPPQEAKLVAKEHYGQEFELAKKIAGSPTVDRVDAWDHADCDGIATEDVLDIALPDAGCGYAVEGAYQREDLDVVLRQYILVFDGEDSAAAAAEQFGPDSLAEDVSFSDDADGGARAGLVDPVNEYVVLTVGELGSQDEAEDASDVIGYFHMDNVNVMRFT